MDMEIIRIYFIYTLQVIALIALYPIIICFSIANKIFQRTKSENILGEIAVITGAAQGLGREIAIELAKQGCHIAIVDINEELAIETAELIKKTYGVKTKAYKVDVSNYQQLQQLQTSVSSDLGDVTILINNAGIIFLSDINQPDFAEIQKLVNVNITAHFWINQLFLPKMKELNRGHIVAISSLSALFPIPLLKFYAPTKSAVRAHMASLRMYLKSERSNVKISTIMPTFLTTNQPTKHIVNATGLSKLCPLMDGPTVAKEIVKEMMNGVEEMTIPRIANIGYKLMEILPSETRDQLWLMVHGKKFATINDTRDIVNILNNTNKNE